MNRVARWSLIVAAFAATAGSAQAQSVADFYKGKTITIVIGYTPGGGYDAYARLLARFIGSHIPGQPNVVPENRPGAGSRTAVNYIYSAAPKDGTVLGTADQSLPLEQALGDKTLSVDTSKLNWIGNMSADNNVVMIWAASGIKTIADAQAKAIAIGATGGSTSSQYPKAMNALLGTKFKLVLGYPGGNDINLAMENREVDGRGSNSWASVKGTRPDWLRDNKINIIVQIGPKKAVDLPDVPLLSDLGKTDEDKTVLRLLSSPSASAGRSSALLESRPIASQRSGRRLTKRCKIRSSWPRRSSRGSMSLRCRVPMSRKR
jgi:tripartite-type tricarboxylate transporter receptor subunit TctC